jgi:hypothetical protein
MIYRRWVLLALTRNRLQFVEDFSEKSQHFLLIVRKGTRIEISSWCHGLLLWNGIDIERCGKADTFPHQFAQKDKIELLLCI